MTTGNEARSKVEEITRNRRTRRTRLTRRSRSRRQMRTGRRHLPRKEKLTRRRSRDVPGVGASTTWRGAITKKSYVNSAMSAPTSKLTASTRLQPKPPRQPSSTPSGKPSWPTWPATWLMNDWPDPHGNHGQRSG